MENRNQPEPNRLLSDSDNEDVILDLTEEVMSADGDSEEIIELTQFIEEPEESRALSDEDDRESGLAPEDEGGIELIDEALLPFDRFEQAASAAAESEAGGGMKPSDSPLSESPPEEDAALDSGADPEDEGFIELIEETLTACDGPVDSAGEMKPSDSSLKGIMLFESAHEKDLEPDSAFDFVDSLGMDLEREAEIGSGFSCAQLPPDAEFPVEQPADESRSCGLDAAEVGGIDEDRLRAAVERAVEKILSEKLEPILIGAIEKGLTREIEKLNRLLLEEDPDRETE
jgi:hypothetical protein